MLVQFLLPGFGTLPRLEAQKGHLVQFNYACHCVNGYFVHRWVEF